MARTRDELMGVLLRKLSNGRRLNEDSHSTRGFRNRSSRILRWSGFAFFCLVLLGLTGVPVLGQSTGTVVFVGSISTVAGNGTGGFSGDGGPATQAELGNPFLSGNTMDAAGNLYIADSSNARIRKVDTSGIITTFAGNGTGGYSGDGGPATSAAINGPSGIVTDAAGNVYFAEFNNQDIRKVDTSGIISTYAALPGQPVGLAIDAAGNLYAALWSDEEILKVATDGTQTVVAGDGTAGYSGDGGAATSASLDNPNGVYVDVAGNIFINDVNNEVIRKVDASGNISTFAGDNSAGYSGDGGPATSAQLSGPQSGVVEDQFGNVFIADGGNNVVREVNTSGIISTVAGTGTAGYAGDGGPASAAELNFPAFLSEGNDGALYITDTYNNVIRKVGAFTGLSFGSVNLGQLLSQTVGVENKGTAQVNFSSIAATGDFSVAKTGTCTTGTPLDVGSVCTVVVDYTPSATGSASGTLTLIDDASPTTQTLPLSGTGIVSGSIASLSPASLAFGGQGVGKASSPMTVTVTNTGSAGLTFNSGAIMISGTNASDFSIASDTCTGTTVAASATCTVGVTFTPAATGGESASLTLTDNAPDTPQSVPMTGTGVDFSMSAATSTASVAPGGTATFNLQVAPEGGFTDAVTLSCTGMPARSTCTVSPGSVTLDGTNNATATVSVVTKASSAVPPLTPFRPVIPPTALWVLLGGLAGLIAAARFAPRRVRVRIAAAAPLALLLLAMVFSASCGSNNAAATNPGTPAGTYSLTITGTSGSLMHTASLTLTVQ